MDAHSRRVPSPPLAGSNSGGSGGVEEATLDLYTAVRNAYLQQRQRVIQEGVRQSSWALSGEPGRHAAGTSDAREPASP
jgi:hypothetical protein